MRRDRRTGAGVGRDDEGGKAGLVLVSVGAGERTVARTGREYYKVDRRLRCVDERREDASDVGLMA